MDNRPCCKHKQQGIQSWVPKPELVFPCVFHFLNTSNGNNNMACMPNFG